MAMLVMAVQPLPPPVPSPAPPPPPPSKAPSPSSPPPPLPMPMPPMRADAAAGQAGELSRRGRPQTVVLEAGVAVVPVPVGGER